MGMGDNYELYDQYERLDNDITYAIRVPRKLRDDFINCTRNSSKMLRRLMIDYIEYKKKEPENN